LAETANQKAVRTGGLDGQENSGGHRKDRFFGRASLKTFQAAIIPGFPKVDVLPAFVVFSTGT
jgi:hypothetical protein